MTLSDAAPGPVFLSSGRWVRTDVRRYPRGVCPRCHFQGCLKRNPAVADPLARDGWLTRQHRDPRTGEWCLAHDAVTRPIEPPQGWD